MAMAASDPCLMVKVAKISDPVIIKSSAGVFGECFWKKVRKLASGTTCDIFLGCHNDMPHKTFAIKMFKKDEKGGKEMHEEKFRQEVSILQGVMHPHIVKMFAAVECPDNYAIVLEHCQRGDLIDLSQELTGRESVRYGMQVACAIHYLHSFRIIHGDLKVDNILVDQNNIAKLCDFGQARVLPKGNDMVKIWGGTELYVAPEWKTNFFVDAFKMDMYAFGIILWLLFTDDEPEGLITPAMIDGLKLPQRYSVCLKLLLKENPTERANISQILAHFQDYVTRAHVKKTDNDDKEKQKEEEMD